MRKTVNNVTLEGLLYGHTLEVRTSQKGVTYIRGTVDIQTDDEGLNIVPVNFSYVAPTYPAKGDKPERPNPNYKLLEKIMNTGKTVLTDGADAWKVRLTPSLSVNDFPNRDGEMIAAKRVDGGFVTILDKFESKDRNKFTVDLLITGVKDIDANPERGIAEDYIELIGYFFDYAGAIKPANFAVKSQGGIDYFRRLEPSKSNPVFTKVWGPIQSQTIVTRQEEESAFGEASVREFTRTTRDWVITGAAQETYEIGDAEIGITAGEINKALADREVYLAGVKKQNEEYRAQAAGVTASTGTAPAQQGGFNF